jgi:hypothetical protein
MTKANLEKFFKDFKYLKHKFKVEFFKPGRAFITGSAVLIDVDTGKKQKFTDSREIGYTDFNEFELLNYMRNWMMNLAIHENDERIMYKGKKVFNPHKVWSHIMEL